MNFRPQHAAFLLGLLPLQLIAADIALDDLNTSLITTGWGKVQPGKSAAGLPLTIGNQTFTRGIGVHAPSLAEIQLDGKATRFSATIGINHEGRNEPGSVEFIVQGDGKTLFSSPIMHGEDQPLNVNVPLLGVRRLKLSVTNGGDNQNSDHANWANATISYDGTKPTIVAPSTDETAYEPQDLYPPTSSLTPSPGHTTWFVNPTSGDDHNDGKSSNKAWKSIAKVNHLNLSPGDKVRIAPGIHQATLKPTATGTAENPITIEFLPGTHEFAVETALARPWFISNSCDAPKTPKPVAILVEHSQFLTITGSNESTKPLILMGGRMIEVINHQAQHITYQYLTFDLKRPTVSEFRVLETDPTGGTIQIAEGSSFAITNGKFKWTGDWGKGPLLCQLAEPESGRCWRGGNDPFSAATATDLGHRKVKLSYPNGNGGLVKGRQYHFRLGTRDSVGAHNNHSKNITFRHCTFNALTNMGIVSQFTENLTFDHVHITPPADTIRTCPAWADALHFSSCKGQILVDSCSFSGLQDDPINVHGTHLRIIAKPTANQLHLRFMQPQTYGFAAFMPGDEVAVISHTNLRELPNNPRRKVTAISPLPNNTDGKDWLLTLDGPAPEFQNNDVIDNLTWYPDVTARNCHVTMAPTRGFLLTTRGKVVVENCTFHRCAMPAILIEDDANGWFESGPIRDMLIRNNRFIACGIEISPKSQSNQPDQPVHENIRILDNFFDHAGISARNTSGLVITGNRSSSGQIPIQLHPSCSAVTQQNNSAKATP